MIKKELQTFFFLYLGTYYSFMNTMNSDTLNKMFFAYFILGKYAISDAVLVYESPWIIHLKHGFIHKHNACVPMCILSTLSSLNSSDSYYYHIEFRMDSMNIGTQAICWLLMWASHWITHSTDSFKTLIHSGNKRRCVLSILLQKRKLLLNINTLFIELV